MGHRGVGGRSRRLCWADRRATPRCMSRRCAECRRWFEPKVSARETQRVCGPACRKRRHAGLARRRRRADVEGARAEERERQRQHRERVRREARVPPKACRASPEAACSGRGSEGCHSPASVRKHPNVQQEIVQIVDNSLALSLDSFERAVERMRRQLSRIASKAPVDFGQTVGRGWPLSRDGLSA